MTETNAKYNILINMLDGIVQDGAVEGKRSIYRNASSSQEARDQARARAYVHLFLEARYGLFDFEEREKQITESSYDGGIDAYHIDQSEKQIILIQSKFRTNAENFQDKPITIGEISRIDADRILAGETRDAHGNAYSGHILGLQRKIDALPDLPRYKYKVVLLANVRSDEILAVEKLFSEFDPEIYDHGRCYRELVIPVLRGEQSYFPDLQFQIDLSNKSAGSRLKASIKTASGPVEVTVILAPTLEIARFMSRYRNSILRYNPRSYLEFANQSTNGQIRHSIKERTTGEFALLNNGITIISDETSINERTARKDRAMVLMRNPQIINGGQTAFTLSRVYDESSDLERATLFEDKEVVVRIITLSEVDPAMKMNLIREISAATNSQTQVVAADRVVVNDEQRDLAERVFMRHGILYEYKRGEYSEAVRKKFVSSNSIVERSLFLRLMLVAAGKYELATRSKSVKKGEGFKHVSAGADTIDRFGLVYEVYRAVAKGAFTDARKLPERLATVECVLVAIDMKLRSPTTTTQEYVEDVRAIWSKIVEWCLEIHQQRRRRFSSEGARFTTSWAKSEHCPADIRTYLKAYGLCLPYATERTIELPIIYGNTRAKLPQLAE